MIKSKTFILLRKLFFALEIKRKVQFSLLIILNVVSSYVEAIAISSSYPFLSLLQSPELVANQNSFLNGIFQTIGIEYQFNTIVVFFMVSILFSSFLKFLVIAYNAIFANILAYDFSLASFNSSLTQEYKFFLDNSIASLVNRNIKGIEGTLTVIYGLLQIITSLFLIIITSIFLIFLNPKLTISIFILITLIYTFIFSYFKNFMSRASRIIYESNSNKIKIAQEAYRYFKNIILDKTGNIFFKSYKKNEYQFRRVQAQYQIIVQTPKIVIENTILFLLGVFALIIIPNINNINVTVLALIGTYAFSFQRLMPIAQAMFLGLSDIKRFSSDLEDVLKLSIKKYNNYSVMKRFEGQIELNSIIVQNINYFNKRSKKNLFNNINFSLKPGDYLGISGKSGSGKSTLLDILIGFLQPSSGKVLVNGIDIHLNESKNYLLKWQNSVSYVSQSPLILNNTIRENLLISCQKNNKISDKEILKILEIVQLKNFVESLPYKLDTNLGDDGNTISGGQKQRIAIARALLKKGKILILDEATVGLDNRTESNLLKNIISNYPELIIIFVSHNPNVFEFANILVNLDD